MRLRNKKTGEIKSIEEIIREAFLSNDLALLKTIDDNWEEIEPKEPLIKDDKIRKLVREWANYNKTESVYIYNLVFDHAGVCIQNALVRFYDPRLRTNIDVWFQTKAPTFKKDHEYSITELCGEEEE